ncbi:YggT family protein [Spirochaeta cellobiosiphila]|uniref:YggT family protein n=1 Tax=Spirochaeta cellobiosiphila TaxID=504483 RepID=UPI00040F86D6|nr:YggT family protein [Spirochaeta cellobiosiphila]
MLTGNLFTTLNILRALISAYSVLLVIRIFLTWFGDFAQGGPIDFLGKITDPYLNIFRRIPWLRIGVFDMSPVIGLLILSMTGSLLNAIIYTGKFTLGIVLSILLSGIWSVAQFLFQFLLIVTLIRLVSIHFFQSNHPIWMNLDRFFYPIVDKINKLKRRGNDFNAYRSDFSYPNGLIAIAVISLAMWIGGAFLISLLSNFLMTLPI